MSDPLVVELLDALAEALGARSRHLEDVDEPGLGPARDTLIARARGDVASALGTLERSSVRVRTALHSLIRDIEDDRG